MAIFIYLSNIYIYTFFGYLDLDVSNSFSLFFSSSSFFLFFSIACVSFVTITGERDQHIWWSFYFVE
jgi:hypothetical protein